MTATPAHPAAIHRTATLTRIRLNTRSRAVRRDLANPGSLHKTVMTLAPDALGDQPRRQAGLLFRLEHATPTTPLHLLVQSHQPPDLTRLPPTYGTSETRDLAPMFQALTARRRVRYRITANPCVRRKIPATDPLAAAATRYTAVPLQGDDALAWWQRKATLAGLALEAATLTPHPASRHPITSEKTPGTFRYALTRFDGTATVTDPDALRHALLAGVGRGKSYGAGLLSLAPA
ncbi:type I-E CRISPR-associated protein Cas6/Cse3/CasE [Streptomyces sp. NPDC054796]